MTDLFFSARKKPKKRKKVCAQPNKKIVRRLVPIRGRNYYLHSLRLPQMIALHITSYKSIYLFSGRRPRTALPARQISRLSISSSSFLYFSR